MEKGSDKVLFLVKGMFLLIMVTLLANVIFSFKPYCDSDGTLTPSTTTKRCEACPLNGSCSSGQLRCVVGFRYEGGLCVEDEAQEDILDRFVAQLAAKLRALRGLKECGENRNIPTSLSLSQIVEDY